MVIDKKLIRLYGLTFRSSCISIRNCPIGIYGILSESQGGFCYTAYNGYNIIFGGYNGHLPLIINSIRFFMNLSDILYIHINFDSGS